MKKRYLAGLAVGVMMFGMAGVAGATTLDFEGVPYAYHENGSGNNLGTYYPGVSFGPEATIYDAGSYDNIHYPSHSGISVLSSGGRNIIDIIFDNQISGLSLWYTSATSSNNLPNKFELKAYSDTAMTNLLGSVVGPYNWGSISELALNYDNIIAVNISGAAYHFTVDDITYTPISPVPEPATMLLFGTGIAGLAGSRFRKKK